MNLPTNYRLASIADRRKIREEYSRLQDGKCYYCNGALAKPPVKKDEERDIDKRRFPEGFFKYPAHLHHNHTTGMTIGTVHAWCNAVLWQYHGE